MNIISGYAEYDEAMAEYMRFGQDIAHGGMSFYFLETVKRALQDHTLPESVKQILERRIRQFHGKLSLAIMELTDAKNTLIQDRARYALHGRTALQKSIQDLKEESDLLHKFGVELCIFSIGLHSSILSPENFALVHETNRRHPGEYLPTSDILLARGNINLGLGKSMGMFVVEGKEDGETNLRSLCQTLRNTSFSEGIPDCQGFRRPPYSKGLSSFELIFKVPTDQPLMSLAHLISTEQPPSFHLRVQLGKKLTQAVCHVHGLKFVHKNIRPRSILLVGSPSSIGASQVPFLLKWTSARKFDSVSAHLGEHLWQQAIYQHPDRQSRYAMEGFEPYHDIYSLGVCLLEILLWRSFTVGSPPPKLALYDSFDLHKDIDQRLTSPAWVLALFEKKAVEQGVGVLELYDDVCRVMSEHKLSQKVWISLAETELASLSLEAAEIIGDCLQLGLHRASDVLARLIEVQ